MSVDSIHSVVVRKLVIPFNIKPVTANGSMSDVALVAIDVKTEDGVVGHAYVWSFSPLFLTPLAATTEALGTLIVGEKPAPLAIESKLQAQLRLIDTPGLMGLALAGIDMAVWDIHAKQLNLPLSQLLGADATRVQAYNSCGLWIQDPAVLADEAEKLLQMHHFNALKLRVGRADPLQDLNAIRQVKARIGSCHLMVDYNQSQTVTSALERAAMIDGEGLYWIEEPVRHCDYTGSARVAAATTTPIQTGENLCSDFDLQAAIAAGAADYYMPDVQRIGGVSGWLRAAALCNANDLPMSSHLFPEVSAHLLAATPTCHWLEYVDWANPVLKYPLVVENGQAVVPQRPGIGVEWNEDAIDQYLV
jgi:mandelate racemase